MLTTDNRKHLSRVAGFAISIVIVFLAIRFLYQELTGLTLHSLRDHIQTIPVSALLASIGFTICSYLLLTSYDVTALVHLKHKLPYRRTALTSFIAYSVGYNVGLSALSGGSVRYRLYSLAGISVSDIGRIIVFVMVTFTLGACALLGLAFLLSPVSRSIAPELPGWSFPVAGVLLLLIPVSYLCASLIQRSTLGVSRFAISLPRPLIATTQIGISAIDLMLATATLYVFLAPSLEIGFYSFLGIYLVAMVAGLVSSVPGGIGVFEAVLITALPTVDTDVMIGSILVYRFIYYLAPLVIAIFLVLAFECRLYLQRRKPASPMARW